MIYDTKEHAGRYQDLSPRFKLAFDYLAKTDFSHLAVGRYPIDGDAVFALVQEAETRSRGEAKWESHRKYADIQFLLAGGESIGAQKTSALPGAEPFNAEKDIGFYAENGKGFFVDLAPGEFAVFFPDDAHMPLVAPAAPAQRSSSRFSSGKTRP